MRTSRTSYLDRASVLSGVLLALSLRGVQAQPTQPQRAKPPEPITVHPQIAPAESVGADGNKGGAAGPVAPPVGGVATIAPIGGAAEAVGVAQAANPAALRSSLVLSQLLDGGQSVEDLVRSGDLTPEVARYILSNRVNPWGQVDGRWADGVRRGLAGLVWREGREALHKQAVAPQSLPRYFRLWLADYLGNVGDEQVLAVGEGILKDTPKPLGGDDGQGDKPLVFQTIERMARYMAARGQQVESALMWERLPSFYEAKEWWNADAMLEAARMWNRAGQEQKAKNLYTQVAQYNNPWLTGIAAWDSARIGIRRSEYVQVAASLTETLRSHDVGDAKLALLALLSGALSEMGDFKGSRTYATQAVAFYKAMDEAKRKPWMKDVFDKVEGGVGVLNLAEQSPLSSPTQAVALSVNNPKERTQRLSVHSLQPFIMSVSSTCPGVEAKVVTDPWEEASNLVARRNWEVIVTIRRDVTSSASKNTQGEILIQSPQFPHDVLRMPVKVSAQ